MKTGIIGLATIIIFFSTACRRPQEQVIFHEPYKSGENRYKKTEPSLVNDTLYYHIFRVKKDSLKFINNYFNDSQLHIILALNRVDFLQIYRLDSLVIPDTFIYNLYEYSPFPVKLPALDSINKILLFSYPIQAFAAYENGTLLRWGPTSMGKKNTLSPDGLFHTNWRASETISTEDSTWILKWYFNIDNFRGISIHQYDLPGYPASHSCLRLREEDAKWIYNWAYQWQLSNEGRTIERYGTPVVVFGKYDFSKPPPWHNLPADPEALMVSADTLNKEINLYLPLIKQRQFSNKKDTAVFLP